MISTISRDLQASDDWITQKWIGRLSTINKKTHKEVIESSLRVLVPLQKSSVLLFIYIILLT
jgi:hypothetical protein